MKIPDLKARVIVHASNVIGDLLNLPNNRPLMPSETEPILRETRTLICAMQYLHDLVSGHTPPPPPS